MYSHRLVNSPTWYSHMNKVIYEYDRVINVWDTTNKIKIARIFSYISQRDYNNIVK